MRPGARKKRIRKLPRSRMVGAHPEPPSRLHRLGDLRGQSRRASPPTRIRDRIKQRRRRERRQRPAARPGRLRTLRAPAAHPLHRTHRVAGLPLRRQDHRRMVAASTASASAAVQIDDAVAQAVLAASRQPVSRPPSPRPSGSKPITTVRSPSGAWRSSGPATRRNAPNVATAPSIPTTAWSPAGSKREWEQRLRELETAKAELARREQQRPRALSADERSRLLALGADLAERLEGARPPRRATQGAAAHAARGGHHRSRQGRSTAPHLTLRWRGGALTELDLDLPRSSPAAVRTDEDTIALVRRLAVHYPDAVIAGILNRQERTTAYGHRFTATIVSSLRRHWNIPRFEPPATPPEGELLTIKQAAAALGVATSTVHRWLNDGFIAGEQLTPGAPWRIRLTDELRAALRRRRTAGLPHHVPSHAPAGRLPPDRVAACQARRVRRRPRQARSRKGLRIKVDIGSIPTSSIIPHKLGGSMKQRSKKSARSASTTSGWPRNSSSSTSTAACWALRPAR